MVESSWITLGLLRPPGSTPLAQTKPVLVACSDETEQDTNKPQDPAPTSAGKKPTNSPDETTKSPPEDAPETLFQGEYDEDSMEGAMKTARKEVKRFITMLEDGSASSYAVKVPIVDGEETEHFWIIDVSYDEGKFTGTINNDPGLVSNVKIGQRITVTEDEISDWLYVIDKKMHGNYTLRVMLPEMEDEEANLYRKMLAPLPQ